MIRIIHKVTTHVRQIRLLDGTLAGTLTGDWSYGFTARTATGTVLGYWPPNDPDARDTAIEAITAVATVGQVLGGEVIEVRGQVTPYQTLKALQDVA
jgi:hypothetical protein